MNKKKNPTNQKVFKKKQNQSNSRIYILDLDVSYQTSNMKPYF